MGDITLVAKEFPPELAGHRWHSFTVIQVAWTEIKARQLAAVMYSLHLNLAEPSWRRAKDEWLGPAACGSRSKFKKKAHEIFNNIGLSYTIQIHQMMV